MTGFISESSKLCTRKFAVVLEIIQVHPQIDTVFHSFLHVIRLMPCSRVFLHLKKSSFNFQNPNIVLLTNKVTKLRYTWTNFIQLTKTTASLASCRVQTALRWVVDHLALAAHCCQRRRHLADRAQRCAGRTPESVSSLISLWHRMLWNYLVREEGAGCYTSSPNLLQYKSTSWDWSWWTIRNRFAKRLRAK